MKIIHIISGLSEGGAQSVLMRIIASDKKYEHQVISFMDEGIYGQKILNLKCHIHTLNMPKGKLTFKGIISLYKILKKERPDVVQTWMYHADLVGGIIAKLAGVKKIIWNIRNSSFTIKSSSFATYFVARLCAFFSKFIPNDIIINSYEAVNFHKKIGYNTNLFTVINNGFDNEIIYKKNKPKKNQIIFGMLARWDPQKDYENLFISASILKKKTNVDWLLYLGGSDIDINNKKIKNLIKKYNIVDKIKLLGSFNNPIDFYNLIDVHVLSSQSEGFPNVLAESMLCELPNISTKAGDSEKILNKTGWLVNTKDPQQFSDSMLSAINLYFNSYDEFKEICLNSRKQISYNFSLRKMIDSFDEIWDLKPKKIFHIISGLSDGGAQVVLYRILKFDNFKNYQIISFMDEGIYGHKIKDIGYKVHTLNMPKGKLTFKGIINLYKILKKERPDVVQTWMYHADLVGGIIAKLAGVKKIIWNIRNSNLNSEWSPLSTRFIAIICAFFSRLIPYKIVSCSERALEIHQRMLYTKDKFIVIHNGYKIEEVEIKKIDNKTLKLGMLARWDPQKDYLNLFKSLYEFKKIYNKNWNITLAGPGINLHNKELVNLISHYKLYENVKLVGPITNIKEFFKKIDLHVLSSAGNEGFPNVVAEAMMYNVPCISTDVGDAKKIIEKTGWVVHTKNPLEFAKAIKEAAEEMQDENKWYERRKNAHIRIANNFTIGKTINKFKKVWGFY